MKPTPERREAVADIETEIPMIERTRTLFTPMGDPFEVNVFDFNIKYVCNSYVQSVDGRWIKALRLMEKL